MSKLRNWSLKTVIAALVFLTIVAVGNVMSQEQGRGGLIGAIAEVTDSVGLGPDVSEAAGTKQLPKCGYSQGCAVNFSSWGSHYIVLNVTYRVITSPNVLRYTSLTVWCDGPTVCWGTWYGWPSYGLKYVSISTGDPPTTFHNYWSY